MSNVKKEATDIGRFFFICTKLLVLSLTCSLRLLLTLYAGLLIVLSLAELGKDSGTSTLTLKTTERTVKRLAVFYFNFCHLFFPPLALKTGSVSIFLTDTLILYYDKIVLSIFK